MKGKILPRNPLCSATSLNVLCYIFEDSFPSFFLTERMGYYPGAAAHETCEGVSLELLYHLPTWPHRMAGYTGETCGHQ